jgi:hypothetical protein
MALSPPYALKNAIDRVIRGDRSAADSGEYRKAAGVAAEAVARGKRLPAERVIPSICQALAGDAPRAFRQQCWFATIARARQNGAFGRHSGRRAPE